MSSKVVTELPAQKAAQDETLYSPRQIEGLIAEGRKIIIVNEKVLKVDSWLRYHPGGDKAILHMVGRDATDEVSALHSAETQMLMQRYRIGRIEGRWKNMVPPIQGGIYRRLGQAKTEDDVEGETERASTCGSSRAPSPVFDFETANLRSRQDNRKRTSSVSSLSSAADEEPEALSFMDARTKELLDFDLAKYPPLDSVTQADIVDRYRQLNIEIRARGLYNCNYSAYAVEVARYSFLFFTMLVCLRKGWYGVSGLFMGAFWHQLAFTAHDAGHMGITHNFKLDTFIGLAVADYMGGLSLGWWKRSHNVHHIVTNSTDHDPDIQYMPLFAISHKFFDSLTSTYHDKIMEFDSFAKAVLPYQAYLYYPVLTLGRFNLYIQSWMYLILRLGPVRGPAWWVWWAEVAGQIFFWTWFGYFLIYKSIPSGWDRFVFIMVSHMVTMPLHVQITLSHFAMSTADLGPDESFPQKMLRTTMDVDCPPWLDFIHGGLQFQAIHHLYPRIPRHNLRETQKLVQKFCIDVGIPYALLGFLDGNKEVIGRLNEVGRQAAILAKCQKTIAERGDILHGH